MTIWIVTQGTRPPRAFTEPQPALEFALSQLNERYRVPCLWRQDGDARPKAIGLVWPNDEGKPVLIPAGPTLVTEVNEYRAVPPTRVIEVLP